MLALSTLALISLLYSEAVMAAGNWNSSGSSARNALNMLGECGPLLAKKAHKTLDGRTEGVWTESNKPNPEEAVQEAKDCIAKKNAVVQTARALATETYNNAVITGNKMVTQGVEKPCISDYPHDEPNCLAKNYVTKAVNDAFWNLVSHSNVSQVYMGKELMLMDVVEVYRYVVDYLKKKCATAFADANLIAKTNVFGQALQVIGNLIKPAKQCLSCGGLFGKGETGTADGAGKSCSKVCSEFGILDDASTKVVVSDHDPSKQTGRHRRHSSGGRSSKHHNKGGK